MNKELILSESAKRSAYCLYNDLKSYILRTYQYVNLTDLDSVVESFTSILNIKNFYFEDWLIAYLKEMLLNDIDLKEIIRGGVR